MKKKKIVLVITMIVSISLLLYSLVRQGLSDEITTLYSSEPAGNIGAWYDEAWEAGGFYMLQQVGTSDNFRYEYRAAPVGVANATFVQAGSAQNKQTQSAGPPAHIHGYTDATAGASLPQDLIVTEWKVAGHVHFAASQ